MDDAKFWLAGDLGSELDKGQFEWAQITFDPATISSQRLGSSSYLKDYV